LIAWVHDAPEREAMGAVPAGVRVATFPDDVAASPEREHVEFVVPRWGDVPALHTLPSLRVVQVLSAGVDWIIGSLPPGVTLCSARGARDRAMAEWVVWAILADVKDGLTAAGQQAGRVWRPLAMRDLHGARVLILGHGSIGAAVERMLDPFGVEVLRVARRARDGVHGIVELGELLPAADVVVNLLPATAETDGLIDGRALARMRPGALLVNGGRGTTVDTGALLEALESGRLRAVLDVVDPEPLPEDHPLWTAPNLVITPHSAGDTPGAERAAWALAGEQLRRYAAGDPLCNVVREY
jgi:phosphoglycerate dehydrogenase-like enzyme